MARDAHSADDCRRRALFMTTSSNEPSSTEQASVEVACAWMHLLKLRKTAKSQGRRAARTTCAEDWRRHAKFMAKPSKDGAGKRGACLRLDAPLEAAEDGQVAGPQVRRRDEAQHDVRELRLHPVCRCWPGCWPCPREGSTFVLPCPVSARLPLWP